LRQFSTLTDPKRNFLLLFVPIAIGLLTLAGCLLQKPTKFNRTMQNLTAEYNILFDANQILTQKQADYTLAFIDSYNEILNVYPDTTAKTTTPDKDLQAAVDKANKIINYKDQSHYLGNAYLVLGKANFLAGQYFNAVEYCAYVVKNFPKQKDIVSEARVWQARALLYLGKLPEAKLVLDTSMLENVKPKKINPAGIYATRLQYDIDIQNDTGAEVMAVQAIHYCKNGVLRLRWRFILAQLEEINNKNAQAFADYSKIAKSNAEFEMAFNADLNRIRMEDAEKGVKMSRIDKLRSLLKNPNNKEFQDQIYYQIGQLHLADKQLEPAIKDYKLSIRSSVKNQNQKGLSYLRIADINFNDKADYITAKKYYDSTLTTLSPNYPGYNVIQKKTNNLQLLTDRLQIVSREDTLQMLARLSEGARAKKIDSMVNQEILNQQAIANSAAINKSNGNSAGSGNLFSGGGSSTFYFYNSTAVSQGYADFKKVWGNRKLEDDWRRSNKLSNAASGSQNGNRLGTDITSDPTAVKLKAVTAGNFRQQIIQNLPLTPDLLAQSNMRIYNAYFDIANFYRDILGDKKGAIGFYELMIKRFPNNPNLPAVYYSMYRIYSDLKDEKANVYKDKLIKNYPETAFAKVIQDPDYSKKLNDKDAEANSFYSEVYDLYAHKKYTEVINRVDEILKEYPTNKYAAQLYYLRAIAAGHNEPVAPFKSDLEAIVKNYPNDKLITPLVTQHINYINANLVDMSARHFALSDADPNEVPFTPLVENKKETAYRRAGREMQFNQVADVRKPEPKPEAPKKVDSVKKVVADPLLNPKKTPPKPTISSIYSLKDSTDYYFVINIANDNTNLASSRFGIGQFNRANLQDADVKHQLMDAGYNNRLIYIGRFYSLAAVKKYARAIIPIMPEIMKVPKDKYTYFIITGQNLYKVTDKKSLDSYIDYYQNNY
jgi:outer membrane protein assembly factor BamD (BamD/ComL family)